jgi:hypothetical protein
MSDGEKSLELSVRMGGSTRETFAIGGFSRFGRLDRALSPEPSDDGDTG